MKQIYKIGRKSTHLFLLNLATKYFFRVQRIKLLNKRQTNQMHLFYTPHRVYFKTFLGTSCSFVEKKNVYLYILIRKNNNTKEGKT